MIAEALLLIILAVLVAHAAWRLRSYVDNRIDTKFRAATICLKGEMQKQRASLFAEAKAYMRHSQENMLANPKNVSQNDAASQPASPPEPEAPFWKNRDKLEAARQQFEQGDSGGVAETSEMTPLDAMREVDAALVAIEVSQNATDDINAPDNQ